MQATLKSMFTSLRIYSMLQHLPIVQISIGEVIVALSNWELSSSRSLFCAGTGGGRMSLGASENIIVHYAAFETLQVENPTT